MIFVLQHDPAMVAGLNSLNSILQLISTALFIGCVIFVPNFASFVNMKGLGLAISMSGMVACGMLFCLASGDFDLSVALSLIHI